MIVSFSTIVITLFTDALIKCSVCLCLTFYLFFLPQSAYQVLKVFIVFACVTINTADVTTLHINSLKQSFA